MVIPTPQNVTTTYDASKSWDETTIYNLMASGGAAWYDSTVHTNDVITVSKIKYKPIGASGWMSPDLYPVTGGTKTPIKNAGTYEVTMQIKNWCDPLTTQNSNRTARWRAASGSSTVYSTSREATFTIIINKAELATPKVLGANKQPYNDGKDVTFAFSFAQRDAGAYTLTLPAGVREGSSSLIAKDVKEYEIKATLKDNTNYKWASTDDTFVTFNIEVTPKSLDVTLKGTKQETSLVSGKESPLNVVLTVPAKPVHDDESITAVVYANIEIDGTPLSFELGRTTIDSTSRAETVSLKLSGLIETYTYKLVVKTDSTKKDDQSYCYTFNQTNDLSLRIDADTRNTLTWELITDRGGKYTFIDVDGDAKDVTWSDYSSDVFTYNGQSFGFTAIAPSTHEVDVTYGNYGFETKTESGVSITGAPYNAGKYQTIAYLKNKETNSVESYVLHWEIEKAKFDLKDVKWKDDGKLQYSQSGVTAEIDPKTLPDGLAVSYDPLSLRDGHFVDETGTASIEKFTFSDPDMENNYLLPDRDDPDSYDYTGTLDDFEWDKDWEVVKATIQIKWTHGTFQEKNGKDFTAYVLADDQGVIDYLFYETDSKGSFVDATTSYTANQLELVENVSKYYKVKPVFKNDDVANNYILADAYSNQFKLGEFSEGVVLDLTNSTAVFTGKAFVPVIDVKSGSINSNLLEFNYLDRSGNPLGAVPIKVGEYRLEVSIPSSVKGYHFDSSTGMTVEGGKAYFDFEITQKEVSTQWSKSHNPPSLANLDYIDLSGIDYEYLNADGDSITFNDIIKGHSYKIRAVISDNENFVFNAPDSTGDFYATDWVDFTVNENDVLYNPTDKNNPYNPQDPDNPGGSGSQGGNQGGNNGGGSGNDGDGGNAFVDFFKDLIEKHFPLWQVCTMAASALLALIFLIKAIQYGNRAKKEKGIAKKYKAKAYASALLPVFAGDIVALNLSNKVWSIMAFAFVGLALLMFVVALITRHSWKKAELAKEAAIEESEQRKIEAQENKQIALQERLLSAQVGVAGTAAVAPASDASLALIEQMRRDMEAREERYRREEQERREEAARREEAQAQRDDAMKMMFAKLMGNQQGDEFAYASIDDTDMLVQRVIAGLLPAMRDSMQEMLPEATALLAAPSEQSEELLALVEEQKNMMEEQRALVEEQNDQIRSMAEAHNAEMQAMSEQMSELQAQLAAMSQEHDAIILPDNNDEIMAQMSALREQIANLAPDNSDDLYALSAKMDDLQEQLANLNTDNSDEKMAEMADTMQNQLQKIEELQAQLAAMEQERVDGVLLPDNSDEMKAMADAMQAQLRKIDELQAQLAASKDDDTVAVPDQSEEIKALTEQIAAMSKQLAERPHTVTNTVYVEKDSDDDDDDDDEEEEWDSVLDDDDDDFLEAIVMEDDGTVRKAYPNFRMRLKESSDKNREWYTAIKNLFCSQKGVTYRVYKRVEKIRYQGQVIAVIGIAKRSIKLWLALKPYEYDARRYHHKDVSDKPRFVEVPLYVRVSSDRALTRAEELILALFQEQGMEARKRYTDRNIQELIFTLKHNRLLNKHLKGLLCETMHVHDCNVLSDEIAEKCVETKNVDFIDDSVIETVKLDDIDANFQDGNRVTLEKLRKLGLVSDNCTGYTVTADKRLTKPLIIVANDFTLPAVKLIVLTGGRAIRLTQV
ncbi:MAG: uL15 family ribosomal protein [Bacteroides sp.]|nr:uL15 family ribosomal protein [Bacillota bacterium]MCM1456152.1 uL15 family ribosomal protein [Bacteroides sp.]